MQKYRVYEIRSDGHIIKAPRIVECTDDSAVIAFVQQELPKQIIEIWDKDRIVATLKPGRRGNERGRSYFSP